jgi:hypothetical protein
MQARWLNGGFSCPQADLVKLKVIISAEFCPLVTLFLR